MISIDEQLRIIAQGAEEIIAMEELRAKLEHAQRTGKKLVVKLGLDPSAPDIHLGHTVVLRKIKQLQDLGHRAVLIIGDFTGMIGDPTGKSKSRRQLTREEVLVNARTYEQQLFRILDPEKTELRFNSDWLGALSFAEVIALASKSTVARMLERDDFHKRFVNQQSIGVHELFYPLMQAYDSVELKADIEIGGTDQRFNILFGRDVQRDYGLDRQVALFMPLLEGLDGTEKMSKSMGNYVGIDERPNDMYGKLMSIPDGLIARYFELATDIHPDALAQIKADLANSAINPRDVKMRLAREITALYNGDGKACEAEQNFIRMFQRKELPDDIPAFRVENALFIGDGIDLPKLLMATGMAKSASDARRLITQGAVKLNGTKLSELKLPTWNSGDVLQVGKLKYCRLLSEE